MVLFSSFFILMCNRKAIWNKVEKKKRGRVVKTVLLFCFLWSFGSFAGELYGVKMEDKITLKGQEVVLNGLGLRSVSRFGIKVKVYVAGLYLPKKIKKAEDIYKAKGPRLYKMVFLRNVDSENVEKGWRDGFKKNCQSACDKQKAHLKKFISLMSDMRTDQTMTMTIHEGKMEVDVQGRKPKTGAFDDKEFIQIMESVLIGPHSPNAELRKGLLG